MRDVVPSSCGIDEGMEWSTEGESRAADAITRLAGSVASWRIWSRAARAARARASRKR